MLSIQAVTKDFEADDGQRVRAVDGLSLSVPGGQYVALLGPNGSGKTTTFRILSGQLAPDAGTVLLCGHPISFGNGGPREIAHVPQDPRSLAFPEMTLEEQLLLAERCGDAARFWRLGVTGSRRDYYGALLREYGLGALCEKLASPLKALSGGWQQVFGLFLAISKGGQMSGSGRPCILLLDEPTSALDAENRHVCVNLIRKLHAEGRTIIHATHDVPLARELAQRFCIIKRGALVVEVLASELPDGGSAALQALLLNDASPATKGGPIVAGTLACT